jgi:outer membrane murein-binding lipoprotein Lpp
MVDELMKRADNLLTKLLDHNLQVDAQTGAAQIVDELMADRKTMQRGLTAWKKQCDTLTHQVICCGVAASHPDATLTTQGAYAGKWNSAQAEEVRKLRAERDQMREERTAWRVTAENAEKDAARYRWIRENGEPDEGMNYRPDWTPEMYDAAIDAAMKDES